MMQAKFRYYLVIVFLLLVSCSSHDLKEVAAAQQASPTSAFISPTSTPTIPPISVTTSTSIATFILYPTETQTPTPINFSNLPKLKDVILSAEDIKNMDEFGSNPLIATANTTHELKDSCRLDCAKSKYSLEHSVLTIILLRAGDYQEAENIVQSLHNDFFPNNIGHKLR